MILRIDIVTLFPEYVEGYLNTALLKRARKQGLLKYKVHNLRAFTTDRYRTVDDYPFGGGPGMVLKPEPIYRAVRYIHHCTGNAGRVLIMSPQGRIFTQEIAQCLAEASHMIMVCGRYQGIDERVIDLCRAEEISIGNYVLSGGELPALVIAEAVIRLVPGVLGDEDSRKIDSFQAGILGFPQYTRPRDYQGKLVPEVLVSGHQARIDQWRNEQALIKTRVYRPDLIQDTIVKHPLE
ncbi:MAG TPA: tRNA (guanosine(37)-N1)-methyltransferase TrmD [Atribacteraceae bacterium]|nr:tRNA (guanosine(37)-N1)-methyltransferase TrmD [Atribacteraceae bacterium]